MRAECPGRREEDLVATAMMDLGEIHQPDMRPPAISLPGTTVNVSIGRPVSASVTVPRMRSARLGTSDRTAPYPTVPTSLVIPSYPVLKRPGERVARGIVPTKPALRIRVGSPIQGLVPPPPECADDGAGDRPASDIDDPSLDRAARAEAELDRRESRAAPSRTSSRGRVPPPGRVRKASLADALPMRNWPSVSVLTFVTGGACRK